MYLELLLLFKIAYTLLCYEIIFVYFTLYYIARIVLSYIILYHVIIKSYQLGTQVAYSGAH